MTTFVPKPGQVDFRQIRWAPVINCLVKFQNKLLLIKRSEKLNFYPGYWSGISGFLDDHKSFQEKVHEELLEELGLEARQILTIKQGQIFDQDEPKYKKTWIVHPVLIEVNTDMIQTDWESQTYSWCTVNEARKLKLLPGFDKVLRALEISTHRID